MQIWPHFCLIQQQQLGYELDFTTLAVRIQYKQNWNLEFGIWN